MALHLCGRYSKAVVISTVLRVARASLVAQHTDAAAEATATFSLPDNDFVVLLQVPPEMVPPVELASASHFAKYHEASQVPARARCEDVIRLNPDSAPRLWIKGRLDGLGATLNSIIFAMAIANKSGMNFGGVLDGSHISHGVNIGAAIPDFFGVADASCIFPTQAPHMDEIFPDLQFMTFAISVLRPQPMTNIQLATANPQDELVQGKQALDKTLTPAFLAKLRSHVMPGMIDRLQSKSLFRPGVTSVALHIRRGDVHVDDTFRYTTDSWYFSIIEMIRKVVPGAEFHVFSEVERHSLIMQPLPAVDLPAGTVVELNKTNEKAAKLTGYTKGGTVEVDKMNEKLAEFNGYTKRGVTVHLNGDPLDAWAHLSSATILVMAKSVFSEIPGYLNTNCVIAQDHTFSDAKRRQIHKKSLLSWIPGADPNRLAPRGGIQAELHKCIFRVQHPGV